MVKGFYEDLAKARKSEELVKNILAEKAPENIYVLTGDDYQNQGDIMVFAPDGSVHFVEVKDDSCIAKTRNVLCEDEVYYGDNDKLLPGNMHSNYEIYCVLSQSERKLYIIDFNILRANYKRGYYKEIQHPQQITYAYLVELWKIKKWGGLIATLSY
jgi:hypothetical protein